MGGERGERESITVYMCVCVYREREGWGEREGRERRGGRERV